MLSFIFNRYIEVSALAWLWLPLLWTVFFITDAPVRLTRTASTWMSVAAGTSLLGLVLLRSGALNVDVPQTVQVPLSLLLCAAVIFPFTLFAAYQALNRLD